MIISDEEYFFIEWLIIQKSMTPEEYSKLSHDEVEKLRAEWKEFYYGTK